jgi:hypothetical protein
MGWMCFKRNYNHPKHRAMNTLIVVLLLVSLCFAARTQYAQSLYRNTLTLEQAQVNQAVGALNSATQNLFGRVGRFRSEASNSFKNIGQDLSVPRAKKDKGTRVDLSDAQYAPLEWRVELMVSDPLHEAVRASVFKIYSNKKFLRCLVDPKVNPLCEPKKLGEYFDTELADVYQIIDRVAGWDLLKVPTLHLPFPFVHVLVFNDMKLKAATIVAVVSNKFGEDTKTKIVQAYQYNKDNAFLDSSSILEEPTFQEPKKKKFSRLTGILFGKERNQIATVRSYNALPSYDFVYKPPTRDYISEMSDHEINGIIKK